LLTWRAASALAAVVNCLSVTWTSDVSGLLPVLPTM
jgi:hypothetical protein